MSQHSSQERASSLVPQGRLSRRDRLQTRREFLRVMRGGRRFRGEHLVVMIRRSPEPWSRLGLAVAKGLGNAPQRAQMRRLCREVFRALRHQWPKPIDLVVLSRVPWPEVDFSDVGDEISRQLDRVRWQKI